MGKPGSGDAVSWAKAIGKMIDMGAAMDSKLLKAGAEAHHAAIGGLPASGLCAEAKLTGILAALGRMIASVPESKVMDVYNSVGALVDSSVPAYLMSTVKEGDAKAAYAALVDFAGVVKANPITASTPAAPSYPSIGPAASKLSDLALKPIPGASPQTMMKAVDKMIVMGAAMDVEPLRRLLRRMLRPSMALMRRVCCRSPTSRRSMQDSERPLRRYPPARSWMCTTQ